MKYTIKESLLELFKTKIKNSFADIKRHNISLVEETVFNKVFNLIRDENNSKPVDIICTKVFSYCNDFNEEEQEILQENQGYDCYIDYQAFSKTYLENQGYDNDIISNKLIELGCLNEEKVLIHLDW